VGSQWCNRLYRAEIPYRVVRGGRGCGRVLADRADVVAPDCERVAVGLAAALELDQRIEESGYYDRIFEGLAPFPGG
jgi:hypothetical protein